MAKKITPKKKVVVKATNKKAVKKNQPIKKKAAKKAPVKKIKLKVSKKPKSSTKKIQVKAKQVKPVKKVLKAKPAKKIIRSSFKKPVNKKVIKQKPLIKVPKKKTIIKKATPKPKAAQKKPVLKTKAVKAKLPVKKPVQNIIKPPVKTFPTKPGQSKLQTIVKKPIINRTFTKCEANYNRADMFYKNVLKAEIVKRYSCDNEEGRDYLNKDICLTIKINDRETTISEKSRDQDWNDIYVEIFRKYPDEDGWVKFTEAENIGYFFPGRVLWAKMEPIKALCNDILSKAIESGIYKELFFMYPKNSGRLSKTFKINTKTYSFNFIQTYHEEGDNSYYSIGISLPFVLLMDFRIYYKIYKQ